MIRIGDFARLSGVSVATLRHYADLGLLLPVLVGEESGYRFYAASQLATLHRIQVLKSLGFTLREIQGVVGGSLTSEAMADLLTAKKRSAEERLQVERQKVKRLELQIQIIGGLQKMTTQDVQVLTVAETPVAAIHLVLPTNDQAGPLIGDAFDRLFGALDEQGVEPVGACMAVWHSSPDEVVGETLEVVVPIAPGSSVADPISLLTLPETLVASVTHRGPFSEFQTCHIVLKEWLAQNGYALDGAYREIYHTPPGEESVTEVQYPIRSILPSSR